MRAGKRTDVEFLFGLGKLFDDLGDYETALECYEGGNQVLDNLYKQQNIPNIIHRGKVLREQICHLIDRMDSNCERLSCDAVLIAGFLRTGTTMVEQVIGSDSHFKGMGELRMAGNAVRNILSGKDHSTDALNSEDVFTFGNYYRNGLKHLKPGSKIAVDKGVTIFRAVGLFQLAFADLPIIQIKRDPRDTILSNFKAFFTTGQHYCYNIASIIEYLHFYLETIRIWQERFPESCYTLNYDNYVQEPVKNNHELAAWLGNGGNNYLFSFRSAERLVHTASANQLGEQVRTSSSGRAQAYAPYLKEWEAQIEPLYEYI